MLTPEDEIFNYARSEMVAGNIEVSTLGGFLRIGNDAACDPVYITEDGGKTSNGDSSCDFYLFFGS